MIFGNTDSPLLRQFSGIDPRVFLKLHHEYPWMHHFAMLFPICLYIIVSWAVHGFFGCAPRDFYQALRESHPTVTRMMNIASNYSLLSIYAVYMIIGLRALLARNKWKLQFVLRLIFFVVLFSLLLTQFIKYGLGIPRPYFDWPPKPFFQFVSGYNAFPSGHTIAIITAALPLAFWTGKKNFSVFLSFIVTVVCISRLWLGFHHPVDIAGGILVGSWSARCVFQPRHPPMESEDRDTLL